MLKDKNQLVFEDKWPSMRPTILKLLRQEAVTRSEWHDLFWLVHSVCLWDDKVGRTQCSVEARCNRYLMSRDLLKFTEHYERTYWSL